MPAPQNKPLEVSIYHYHPEDGAHARDDFGERDDENWLRRSLYFKGEEKLFKRAVNFRPETMPAFEPAARSY